MRHLLFRLLVEPTNGNGRKNKMITAESEGFPGKTSDLAPAQLSYFKRDEKSCFFPPAAPPTTSQVDQMFVFERTSTQDPSCWAAAANWPVMLPSPRGMCEGPQLLQRPRTYITLLQ